MPLPACAQGNIRLPVVCAPLFIVSGPELTIAQCKAGIIGSFPALNARTPEILDQWLARIQKELNDHKAANPSAIVAPFAVNQICHGSNNRLMTDMALIVKHKVPIVITSLQCRQEIIDSVHSYGGVVMHDIINQHHAKRAAAMGVDGLIPVAAGAGGHAGSLSPFALVRELRQWFHKTIALSGSISDGHGIAGALAMGADFAYIGTRFIATEEANADARYKRMIEEYAGDDIVYSNLFTGVHGNYLKPSIVAAGLDPDNLPTSDKSAMNFGSDRKGGSGEKMEAKAWRDIWGAGQGIGSIKDSPPVAELVGRLVSEFEAARDEIAVKTLTYSRL